MHNMLDVVDRAAAILASHRSACELCARGSDGENPIGPCGWVVLLGEACEGECVHPAVSSVRGIVAGVRLPEEMRKDDERRDLILAWLMHQIVRLLPIGTID